MAIRIQATRWHPRLNLRVRYCEKEGLFERAAELAPYFEEAVHSLKGIANVIDIRNFGLAAGGIEPRTTDPLTGLRFLGRVLSKVFCRVTGDILHLRQP